MDHVVDHAVSATVDATARRAKILLITAHMDKHDEASVRLRRPEEVQYGSK